MDDQPLRIRLAGTCALGTLSGSWERSIPTSQGRLVLARLALTGAPVARDELAELLWPAGMPVSWERHLSAVVSKLRRLLASEPARATIAGEPGTYELRLPPGSVVDVLEAGAAVDRAWDALTGSRLDEARSSSLEAAVLARRPFLPGADALWVDERRDALRRLLLRALDIAVEVAIQRRDPAGVAAAREAVTLDPYREAAYRNLMRVHLALGERAAAADAYRQCRAALGGELGMQPSPEIETLWRSALDATPDAEPECESLEPTGSRPPIVPTTSFVGRDGALAAVAAALRRSRLVTLTGPGGVGKSRLAFEAARRLETNYADGLRSCELSSVVDGPSIAHALAAALGVREIPGAPIEESIVSALARRSMLLVVDNCEHVLDSITALLEQILGRCPYVRILATSRERLAAQGEAVFTVRPLDVPDAKKEWDRRAPALELLLDRVVSVRAGYRPGQRERAALEEICRQLEGLPLAIELAAARVSAMGPVEVARRLDRRFALLTTGWRTALPRHRTLRAAVEWSYELLDETQRRVFERVCVFVGGFTLEAAEQICAAAAGVSGTEVAEAVTSLVDKSILVVDDLPATRYRMLETLREFGRERLDGQLDTAATEEAHALYFTELAGRADEGLRGQEESHWVRVLDVERGNLRAARAWALRSGRASVAVELSAALFWYVHWGMHSELVAWAEEIDLEASTGGLHMSRALAAASDAAWKRGDLARARTLGECAVESANDTPDARYGWHMLGAVALFEGRLDDSREALDRVVMLARRAGDDYHVSDALGIRALAHCYAGDVAAARASAHESRAAAARSGSLTALAWSAYASGEVVAGTNPDEALVHLDRAVELAEAVGAHFIRGVGLLSATSLRSRRGDPATAVRALLRIMNLWEEVGNWRQQWITLREAAHLFVRLGRPEDAAVVLGAIDARDADHVYGADAVQLDELRADVEARLRGSASAMLEKGRTMDTIEVVVFTRSRLGDAATATDKQERPRPTLAGG